MTADREQTRRDAEREIEVRLDARSSATISYSAQRLAGHCLALLAELEQAERERDEARDTVIDQAMRIEAIKAAKELLQGRLAKVPALVEALERIAYEHGENTQAAACIEANAALAAYEQEQDGDEQRNMREKAVHTYIEMLRDDWEKKSQK